MIVRTDTMAEIEPIFSLYLDIMCRFYKIVDLYSWREKALENLRKYARQEDRLIYVLKESNAVTGFALVNQHLRFNRDGLAIAEFYIHKDHGRKGFGRQLAETVFSLSPGNWEVAVTVKNKDAMAFWKQVVSSYTSGDFVEKKKASSDAHGYLFNNK
ncbi:MAG: GNAT family N-acetyltransferase [Proteobacteria bacterium]|nr:GNAT family N-acetyltransferase [Desulfobacula sp.]MBU3953647.1 GNAT family N-acetyltransferase [Pseudomonadota bacterium]MBU4129404.1 GNAT family N-acetyltransferase [Pseudomonadota bacterium]